MYGLTAYTIDDVDTHPGYHGEWYRRSEADAIIGELVEVAASAGVILEGLAASVEWEIAPAIMDEIRNATLPKLRAIISRLTEAHKKGA